MRAVLSHAHAEKKRGNLLDRFLHDSMVVAWLVAERERYGLLIDKLSHRGASHHVRAGACFYCSARMVRRLALSAGSALPAFAPGTSGAASAVVPGVATLAAPDEQSSVRWNIRIGRSGRGEAGRAAMSCLNDRNATEEEGPGVRGAFVAAAVIILTPAKW